MSTRRIRTFLAAGLATGTLVATAAIALPTGVAGASQGLVSPGNPGMVRINPCVLIPETCLPPPTLPTPPTVPDSPGTPGQPTSNPGDPNAPDDPGTTVPPTTRTTTPPEVRTSTVSNPDVVHANPHFTG